MAAQLVAGHDHVSQLIEVLYDDFGQSVREFFCQSCGSSWFEAAQHALISG
jgi:hypothetical protein